MVLAQITDIHIGKEGIFPNNVDVRKNFSDILDLVAEYEIDYLVLTGDFCYQNAEESVYKWVKSKLDNTNLPYHIIAGNHDDSTLMASVFDQNNNLIDGELYYDTTFGSYPTLFLDSGIGEMSIRQKNWIKGTLLANSGNDLVVFMHHPPLYGGVPHMDINYALKDKEELANIFSSHNARVYIFTGHYHVDKIIASGNIVVHITPSCFVQIDQRFTEFSADHYQIGYRRIELNPDFVSSTVHYIH